MGRGRPIVRRDTGDKTASLQRSRLKSITGRSCFRSTIRKVNNSFLPPFSSIFLIRDREIKLNVKSLPILLSRSDRWNRRIAKIIGEEQSVNFHFATIARKGSDSNWSPRSVVNSLVRLVWRRAKDRRKNEGTKWRQIVWRPNVFVISANSLAALRGNVFVVSKRGPQCVN